MMVNKSRIYKLVHWQSKLGSLIIPIRNVDVSSYIPKTSLVCAQTMLGELWADISVTL
jgi:hypothetical protein